jgi:hypothetical protein
MVVTPAQVEVEAQEAAARLVHLVEQRMASAGQ